MAVLLIIFWNGVKSIIHFRLKIFCFTCRNPHKCYDGINLTTGISLTSGIEVKYCNVTQLPMLNRHIKKMNNFRYIAKMWYPCASNTYGLKTGMRY